MPKYELKDEALTRNRKLLLRAICIEVPALFRSFCDELQPLYSDAIRGEGYEDFSYFSKLRRWSVLQELASDKSKMAALQDAISSWCERHRLGVSQWLEDPFFFYDVCLTTLAFRERFVVGEDLEGTIFDEWTDYRDVIEVIRPFRNANDYEKEQARRAFAEGVRENLEGWRETSGVLQARGEALLGLSTSHSVAKTTLEDAGLSTARPRDSLGIEFDRWKPNEQSWGEFAEPLRQKFKEGLEQYKDEHEANMKRHGVVRAEVKDMEHFRWLALAMFGGQDFRPLLAIDVHTTVDARRHGERPEEEYGEDGNAFNESTIKKGIRKAAKAVKVRSPIKQGRPAA